jgi:hypothetical protein
MNNSNVKINGKSADYRVGLLERLLNEYPGIGYKITDIEPGGTLKLQPMRKVLDLNIRGGLELVTAGLLDIQDCVEDYGGGQLAEHDALLSMVNDLAAAMEKINQHLDRYYE